MKECPQCFRCYADRISFCNEDGKILVASLPGGTLFDSRYELEQPLGQGSLGIVYKAHHVALNTQLAIKLITPELAGDDPALFLWFRRGVRSVAAIRHQNLVAITDFAVIESSVPYIVMELVDGRPFAELLAREKRMQPDRALEFLSAIAAGLRAAHKQGVAHGNLKPANILVPDHLPIASSLKVLDLGLVTLRRKDWSSAVDHQQTAFLHSALYRAPELWVEDKPDARSDVYSLATIFYQMLTGVVPFQGDSIDEVRRKVVTEHIPTFDSLGISLSPQLEAAVFGALAKDRGARTPTVEVFLDELHRAISPTEPSSILGHPQVNVESTEYWKIDEPSPPPPVPRSESRSGYQGTQSSFNNEFDSSLNPDDLDKTQSSFNNEFDSSLNPDDLDKTQAYFDNEFDNPFPDDPNKREDEVGDEPPASAQPISPPTPIVDENVQFTVYRPRAVEPEVPYSILIYAHLAERAPDAPASTPEPREAVEKKAREALGDAFRAYADTAEDSQQAIPRNGVLTFQPDFPGLVLAPPQLMLLWRGPLHQLEFSLTAGRELEGHTIRGSVRVYLGVILLAELNIAISVNTAKARQFADNRGGPEPMPTYRKIFASYSHRDEAIVQQFEQLVDAFGDKYLRDVRDIRAGEKWNERLQELIRDADIFQLFWSQNSMKSEFVRDEWSYALSLNKPNFIRPTFWEEPMPEDKSAGLPPAALLELQFKRVPIYVSPTPAAQTRSSTGSLTSQETRKVMLPPPLPPRVPPPVPLPSQELALKPSSRMESSPASEQFDVPTRQSPQALPADPPLVFWAKRDRNSGRDQNVYERKQQLPVMFWLIILMVFLFVGGGLGLLIWNFVR